MTSKSPAPLHLAGQKPVGVGDSKLVFLHPSDDRLLVKVVNPAGKKAQKSKATWYRPALREKDLYIFSRELHEFVVAEAHATGEPSPIARIFGLIQTDLGIGMVVEKIQDRHGQLARSLHQILPGVGLTPEIERLLVALITEINRRHIVVGAFTTPNIVLQESGAGERRLVMVDGFGADTFVPIYSFSSWANTQRNLKKYRRLIRRIKQQYGTAPLPRSPPAF
jgi:hypothetical protein